MRLIILLFALTSCLANRRVVIRNYCSHPVRIKPVTVIGELLEYKIVPVRNWAVYNIPDDGWYGEFWPLVNDKHTSVSKIKFNFYADGTETKYGISLIDGYSLPIRVRPLGTVSFYSKSKLK